MLKNIIFDWSGTLVDDLPAVFAATNSVFAKCGIAALTLETFRAEFCLPFKNFYDRYAPGVPLAELERTFHGHFRELQKEVIELPRAREFLVFCREHELRMFVLSTMHPDYFGLQAAATGFDQYIERAYTGVWDKRAKIAELLTENHLSPRETLFIGDMQHDIETAKRGGVHSCAVLTGYNRLEQLRASDPDRIVEHLGELRGLMERNGLDWEQWARAEEEPAAVAICTVGALIYDKQGRVLMIRTQKWSNLWGIPGGKIKTGEPSVEALRREVREETGLEIGQIEFVMAQDCIFSPEFYRRAHFVLLNYTGRAVGEAQVQLNEEAQQFQWVLPADALALPLNQPTRALLERVIPLIA